MTFIAVYAVYSKQYYQMKSGLHNPFLHYETLVLRYFIVIWLRLLQGYTDITWDDTYHSAIHFSYEEKLVNFIYNSLLYSLFFVNKIDAVK